jgi:hypothetical protein
MTNPEKGEQSKGQCMNNKRRLPRIALVVTFFGVLNLLAMISSPAWANIRVVATVRLIGTGMCFGVAIVSFAVYYRHQKE